MPQAKKAGSSRPKSKRASTGAKTASKKRASAANDAGNPVVDLLQRGIEAPLSIVMLTNERIQEVMDDAVERGRMTRADAEEMMDTLLKRGRRTTEDFIADLEQFVGTATTAARKSKPADRMHRAVDRARRATGVGPAFPILSYDDLTAAQISERLADLSPAELRKVRDYERRHGNRKSVLSAIESKLG
jgi:polyhydroxyalkanoate synthesis regulator phasin